MLLGYYDTMRLWYYDTMRRYHGTMVWVGMRRGWVWEEYDTMLLWYSHTVIPSQCDSMTLWYSDTMFVAMRLWDTRRLWQWCSDAMLLWDYHSVTLWSYERVHGRINVWEYESMPLWYQNPATLLCDDTMRSWKKGEKSTRVNHYNPVIL